MTSHLDLLEFYHTDKWHVADHTIDAVNGATIQSGQPTPIFQDNRMQVYARGSNGHLLEFYRTDKWYCVDHSNETGGVTIEGDPTPIFQDNRMQVYSGLKISTKGFADTHNHQFANLGFGGAGALWGAAFG